MQTAEECLCLQGFRIEAEFLSLLFFTAPTYVPMAFPENSTSENSTSQGSSHPQHSTEAQTTETQERTHTDRTHADRTHIAEAVMSADFLRALTFAAGKHRNQRRKDESKTPYINHPIAVANILLNEADITDEVALIAALLHDTVEDTNTTFEEIEQHFGPTVRAVVAEVTDDKSLPKAVRKQLQIDHAAGLSDRAKLVKLADKISNVRDTAASPPAGWSITRIDEYLNWGNAVVGPIRGINTKLESLFDRAYAQGKAVVGVNNQDRA